jgi:hypothetical protein
MPRRLPKYVQAFVDRRNNQPRHYFRRTGYPLTALPGLPYTPEFMSVYGNALASSEELQESQRRAPSSLGSAGREGRAGFNGRADQRFQSRPLP